MLCRDYARQGDGQACVPDQARRCAGRRVLSSVQVIDATAGWDAAYQRLEKGLLAAGLDQKNLFDWDTRRPPYPGLPAFQEQDAAIFFGRDKEIREGQALLNRLQQFGGPRLTLMLGASGSGKPGGCESLAGGLGRSSIGFRGSAFAN